MDKETLLLKYFAESLSAEEEKAFAALMKEDARFRSQVALEKEVQLVVQQSEREALKSKLKAYESQLPKGGGNTVSKKFNLLKIAASFALLLAAAWFVYQWNTTPNLDDIYTASYERFPNTVYTIARGDTTDNSPERKAFSAYEAYDMKAAITYFEELRAISNLDYVPFYLGQSYLQDGQAQKALEQFESIIKSNTDFKSEALWYGALAHIKLGDKNKAKQQLQLLVAEGSYKKTQAQELLNALD